jgi:hypothetical protein
MSPKRPRRLGGGESIGKSSGHKWRIKAVALIAEIGQQRFNWEWSWLPRVVLPDVSMRKTSYGHY